MGKGAKVRIKRFGCALLSILVIALIVTLSISLLSLSPVYAVSRQHAPIYINGNSGFTSPNPVNGGGSGTAGNPYVIENWVISASSANGIDIEDTTAYFIIRNCLVENGGSSNSGIYFYNVINGTVRNNICNNNDYGIDVGSKSNYNVVDNNSCSNNVDGGIHLWHDNYDNIINNLCTNDTSKSPISLNGIAIYYSYYNNISNNICKNSHEDTGHNGGVGIKLSDSYYDNLINNLCDNNNINGIYLSEDGTSQHNLIQKNTCINQKYGICLDSSTDSYNTLDNNTCDNNSYSGIFLDFPCSNNTIINNTCSNNLYGIYLTSTYNNTITRNYLLNNNHNAHDGDINYWDNNGSGNYWSDYTGVDNYHGENQNIPGPDGIGDTPYNIFGGSNRDRYPLMSPWQPGVVRGVSVSISPSSEVGENGATLTYTVTVTNTGNVSDNYSLSVRDNASPSWSPSVDNMVLTGIAPSANKSTTLRVTIPSNAVVGKIDNIKVTATSQTDNTVKDNNTCTTLTVAAEVKLLAGWNLVGFEAVGPSDTPNKIFTGLTYDTDYFIYYWNAPGGPYTLQGSDQLLKDNTDYWVWIDQDWTVTVP